MKRVILSTMLAFAVYGLFQASTVTAKGPAARPLKIKAIGQVNFITGAGFDSGQISHGGSFYNEWHATGAESLVGTLTAANGDELYWEGTNHVEFSPDLTTTEFTIELILTGGSGRFSNATGSLSIVGTGVKIADPLTFEFSYTGTGEISY